MLLAESIQPFQFTANTMSVDSASSVTNHYRSRSSTTSHHRPHARSMSLFSLASSTVGLRLAEVAKQCDMGVHVENWREDMVPVRQYLPMQHIIGSLKRDRDEKVQYIKFDDIPSWGNKQSRRQSEVAAASPSSEDSFLHVLHTPKRRRTSDCSHTDSQCTSDSDPDRRFSYQAAEHVAKDIPQSALPGLNHILNLATITAAERDIFSEYAPKHLDDAQLLMNEVLQLRSTMMDDQDIIEEAEELDGDASVIDTVSPIVPPERDAEVRRAFENFIDLDGHDRYIAKL